MKRYYVNEKAQNNGDHEVHHEDCIFFPNIENREFLGWFDDCKDAVKEAKKSYNQVNGCIFCSNECHTQ